jgi:hypothetical protein
MQWQPSDATIWLNTEQAELTATNALQQQMHYGAGLAASMHYLLGMKQLKAILTTH